MKISNLSGLLLHDLRKAYASDKIVVSSLAKWAGSPGQGALGRDVEIYLSQTKDRLAGLEGIFKLLGHKVDAVSCTTTEALVAETEQLMRSIADAGTRECAKAAAVQLLRHNLVARYAALVSWAEMVRDAELATLLKAMLDTERKALEGQATGAAKVPSAGKVTTMGSRLTDMFDRKK